MNGIHTSPGHSKEASVGFHILALARCHRVLDFQVLLVRLCGVPKDVSILATASVIFISCHTHYMYVTRCDACDGACRRASVLRQAHTRTHTPILLVCALYTTQRRVQRCEHDILGCHLVVVVACLSFCLLLVQISGGKSNAEGLAWCCTCTVCVCGYGDRPRGKTGESRKC